MEKKTRFVDADELTKFSSDNKVRESFGISDVKSAARQSWFLLGLITKNHVALARILSMGLDFTYSTTLSRV